MKRKLFMAAAIVVASLLSTATFAARCGANITFTTSGGGPNGYDKITITPTGTYGPGCLKTYDVNCKNSGSSICTYTDGKIYGNTGNEYDVTDMQTAVLTEIGLSNLTGGNSTGDGVTVSWDATDIYNYTITITGYDSTFEE